MHCYALSANGSASKHYDAVKQSLFWAVQPDFSGTIKTEIKGQLNSEWIYEVIVSPKMQPNYKDFALPNKEG